MAWLQNSLFGLLAAMLAESATFGGAPLVCRLCEPVIEKPEPMPSAPQAPLRIEVETALDFSRIASDTGQGGDVTVDPRGGNRRVSGGLRDMGGLVLKGTVRVTGTPFAAVRIDLPARVQLRSSAGATAEVVDLKTDLSAAPRLDSTGTLVFSFGGRLVVRGQVSGNFRGNVPITADYE
jgi:Domain of unknown function (DUF4402)